MASRNTPRRRVIISSSSDEESDDGNAGGFLSDDDDDVVNSSDVSASRSTNQTRSRSMRSGKSPNNSTTPSATSPSKSDSDDYVEDSFIDDDDNNSDSFKTDTKSAQSSLRNSPAVHENDSYSSIMSSTPRSKNVINSALPDADVSIILAESMDQISIDGSPAPKSELRDDHVFDDESDEDDDLSGTVAHNRSRSFLRGSSDTAEMSPISKRLSEQNDATSNQKLRERLLKKNMMQAKKGIDTPRSSTRGSVRNSHVASSLVNADLSPIAKDINSPSNYMPSPSSSNVSRESMSLKDDSNQINTSAVSMKSVTSVDGDRTNNSGSSSERSAMSMRKGSSVKQRTNTTADNNKKGTKLCLADVLAGVSTASPTASSRSNSHSSLGSLKSLGSVGGMSNKKSFFTPRKSEVICLSSDDDDDVVQDSDEGEAGQNRDSSNYEIDEDEEDMVATDPLSRRQDDIQTDNFDISNGSDSELGDDGAEGALDETVDVVVASNGTFDVSNQGGENDLDSHKSCETSNKGDSIVCLSSDNDDADDADLNSSKSIPDNSQQDDDTIDIIESRSGSSGSNSTDKENSGVQVLSPAKAKPTLMPSERALIAKYVGQSLEQLSVKMDALKKTMSTVNVAAMPDGGMKLLSNISELEEIIRIRRSSQPKRPEEVTIIGGLDSIRKQNSTTSVDNDIQVLATPRVIPHKVPSATSLPVKPAGPVVIDAPNFDPNTYNRLLTNDNKRLFGGKMTDNRLERVEMVTEKALKGMHKAMNTVPDETQLIETPKGINIDLMQHQKQGLAWLAWRETQTPPGGILADDMGLGKTLSMISLVLHQKNERLKRKEDGNDEEDKKRREAARNNGLFPSNATLVVAPASLIYQWEAEIEKRVKSDRLTIHVFHGPKNKRESDAKRLARHDIVITTYNLLTTELTEKIITESKDDDDSGDDSVDERDNWGAQAGVAKSKKPKNKVSINSDSVLSKIAWARIILDEAHQIKNKNTGSSKSACRLAGTARWCLTGTPIHNNLWDLYSLIRFMRVSPFDEEKHWKEYIMCGTQKAADRLNLLVKNLLIRRTKAQVCNITKKPLVDLPPKEMKHHDLVLEGIEAQVYDHMFRATQQKVKQMLSEADSEKHAQLYGIQRKKRGGEKEEIRNPFNFGPRTIAPGDKFQQMSGMLVMLLRLRQACVHLHLTKEAVDMDAFETQGGDAADILQQTMADMSLDEGTIGIGEDAPGNSGSVESVFAKDYLSCKIKKLMEIVDDCMEKGDKIVIVSQWTSLLGIVEDKLVERQFRYTSITGKVLPCDRQERVESFNKVGRGARVMLLSLTAGGVGLNLVGGNHLVMVDLHWNPALEAQACDRIYRMGQKKTVFIHRLVAQGTIEQRVLDLQKKKLELAGSVLEGAASKKMNKLTMADLKYLFDLEPKRTASNTTLAAAAPSGGLRPASSGMPGHARPSAPTHGYGHNSAVSGAYAGPQQPVHPHQNPQYRHPF